MVDQAIKRSDMININTLHWVRIEVSGLSNLKKINKK